MNLDEKRKRLELMRVQTAKEELKFKVEERLDEIKRLESHIKIQEEAEARILKELENFK